MIEDPLSEDILSGRYKGMDTISVHVEGEGRDKKLVFVPTAKATPALAGVGDAAEGSKPVA